MTMTSVSTSAFTSITYYTGEGFEEINQALRDGDLVAKAIMIDGELAQLPTYTGVSYRGVGLRAFLKGLKGEVFQDLAYLSTSTEVEVAESFMPSQGGVLLEIHGTSGVEISQWSQSDTEEEVLYPRGTKFHVEQVSQDPPIYRMVQEGLDKPFPTKGHWWDEPQDEGDWWDSQPTFEQVMGDLFEKY